MTPVKADSYHPGIGCWEKSGGKSQFGQLLISQVDKADSFFSASNKIESLKRLTSKEYCNKGKSRLRNVYGEEYGYL